MKKCDTIECQNDVGDAYKICFECHKKNKGEEKPVENKMKSWHNDPLVDQLMKMNSNLGRIAKALEDRKNGTPPSTAKDDEYFVDVAP